MIRLFPSLLLLPIIVWLLDGGRRIPSFFGAGFVRRIDVKHILLLSYKSIFQVPFSRSTHTRRIRISQLCCVGIFLFFFSSFPGKIIDGSFIIHTNNFFD